MNESNDFHHLYFVMLLKPEDICEYIHINCRRLCGRVIYKNYMSLNKIICLEIYNFTIKFVLLQKERVHKSKNI